MEIPWPPSANRYWRNVKGRTVVSKEARIYKSTICKLAKTWKNPCLGGRLQVCMAAFPPDKRRRDLDNLNKIVLDSLQKAGLYNDDSQIDYLSIERHEPCKDGRIQIWIWER